jgi:hypothetical protein
LKSKIVLDEITDIYASIGRAETMKAVGINKTKKFLDESGDHGIFTKSLDRPPRKAIALGIDKESFSNAKTFGTLNVDFRTNMCAQFLHVHAHEVIYGIAVVLKISRNINFDSFIKRIGTKLLNSCVKLKKKLKVVDGAIYFRKVALQKNNGTLISLTNNNDWEAVLSDSNSMIEISVEAMEYGE